MNNNYKKRVVVIILILLAVCLGLIAKLFIIGEPVSGEQVYCTTYVNGQKLELQVDTIESSVALICWKYNQYDSTLYISARKVLVSPLFNEGHYKTYIDIEMIENIVLGGKTIWSR